MSQHFPVQGSRFPKLWGAQSNLGIMYYNGLGVEQDYDQAAAWYRKAADQGDAVAQYNLGYSYDEGEGVEKDTVQAPYFLL